MAKSEAIVARTDGQIGGPELVSQFVWSTVAILFFCRERSQVLFPIVWSAVANGAAPPPEIALTDLPEGYCTVALKGAVCKILPAVNCQWRGSMLSLTSGNTPMLYLFTGTIIRSDAGKGLYANLKSQARDFEHRSVNGQRNYLCTHQDCVSPESWTTGRTASKAKRHCHHETFPSCAPACLPACLVNSREFLGTALSERISAPSLSPSLRGQLLRKLVGSPAFFFRFSY